MFRDPGETLHLVGEDRCSEAVLRAPVVRLEPGRIEVEPEGRARAGFALAGRCWRLFGFEGSVAVQQEPYLEPGRPAVRFRVLGSELRPRGLSLVPVERLWGWIRPAVHPRLEALRIDLDPALDDLARALPLFVRREDAERAARLVASLRVESVRAGPDGVFVDLRFEVEETAAALRGAPEAPLTPEEMRGLEGAGRRFDAFLTFVVKRAGRDALSSELRGELLEVLLDARHELVGLLARPSGAGDEPVRALFLRTWSRLAPLLRRVDGALPAESALRYLSFVAAGDVLSALEAAAPGFGLELTSDGLRRLARTLVPGAGDPLVESRAVDPELREIFEFGPPLPLPSQPEPAPEAPAPEGATLGPAQLARLFLVAFLTAPAAAAPESAEALAARLNRWAPGLLDFRDYLPLAARLLRAIAEDLRARSGLERRHADLLPALLLATGWQESCWRQYVRSGAELVPLRSEGGDVGLMQVNEDVWRGFYDRTALRWDIAYNVRAGAEILLHYLRDFAVARREDRHGGLQALARSTYAAYNGGPGQLRRWRDPAAPAALRALDAAFLQKYRAMRAGDLALVERCYTG